MQLFLKILSRMVNSVDPDQTAPSGPVSSGSTPSAYAILSETLVYEILGRFPWRNTRKKIFIWTPSVTVLITKTFLPCLHPLEIMLGHMREDLAD